MSRPIENSHSQEEDHRIAFAPASESFADRDAVLQEILRVMDQWEVSPHELVDPAERQAALGNARRMVDFWQITAEELEGPPPPRPVRQPEYRYTHPKTGETWNGLGQQPAWLRRCLINEGYRLDEVRAPFTLN